MTRDEALSLATDYVRKRYSFVPPIISIQHVVFGNFEGTIIAVSTTWLKIPGLSSWHESIKCTYPVSQELPLCGLGHAGWIIGFFMSWDTDAMGMPQTLIVAITDITGDITEVEFAD